MGEEGIARAEKAACRPSDDRRSAFPDPLEDIQAGCTPKGRYPSTGWIDGWPALP